MAGIGGAAAEAGGGTGADGALPVVILILDGLGTGIENEARLGPALVGVGAGTAGGVETVGAGVETGFGSSWGANGA